MENGGNGPSFLQDDAALHMDNIHEDTDDIQTQADPLQSLIQGEEIILKIKPKSLLIYIMQALGSHTEPVFSEVNCGNNGVRVTIKLDVSELRTVSGEPIMISVVEGQPALDPRDAENNAVLKAFSELKERHRVRIFDFSSRIIAGYESCGVYALISQGMDLLHKLFNEWEMTLIHCENFGLKVVGNQYTGIFGGKSTEKGKIYALLGELFCVILPKMKVKIEGARSDLVDLHKAITDYENSMTQPEHSVDINGHLHAVDLEFTDLLSFLMLYFNLDEPEFSNGPAPNDMVASSILMKFPEMQKHKFSGNLRIEAKAYSSIEATKEVAFQALSFIEKNFPIKIIDFNHAKRQEKLEQLKKLIGLLSKILEVFISIRLMWSKLNNVLECNAGLYSFDPETIFSGIDAGGQIEAYRFCYTGLEDVRIHSMTRLASCGVYIEGLQKLSWELHVLKSKFGLQ